MGRVGGEEFVMMVRGNEEEWEEMGKRMWGMVERNELYKLKEGKKVK